MKQRNGEKNAMKVRDREAELKLIVNVLANQRRVYKCSYLQAWEQYVHPSVKELASFNEIFDFIVTSLLEEKQKIA